MVCINNGTSTNKYPNTLPAKGFRLRLWRYRQQPRIRTRAAYISDHISPRVPKPSMSNQKRSQVPPPLSQTIKDDKPTFLGVSFLNAPPFPVRFYNPLKPTFVMNLMGRLLGCPIKGKRRTHIHTRCLPYLWSKPPPFLISPLPS